MKNKHQHLMSLAVLALFMILAAGSAKINKIHCGAFNYYDKSEEGSGRGYVLLKDGKKIYGDEISWKSGLVVKDQITVDGEKYRIKDTRGYFYNGQYYGQVGANYAKRIISGKLNVYYTEEMVTSLQPTAEPGLLLFRERPSCFHYVQVGEDGDSCHWQVKDIIRFVKDCPKAVAIDLKNGQIRKPCGNRNYLNDIFHVYNGGCR
jgi:hypothetical protein